MQIRLLVYAAVGLLLSAWISAVRAQAPDTVCQQALEDYRVALQSYQDGFYDPAFAGFEAYLLHCPLGAFVGQAHYLLAEMLSQQSKCAKALPHVKEALTQPLDPALRSHVLFLGARCALQLKRSGTAQTYLRLTVSSDAPAELKAPALYWLAELAFEQQDYDEAKRYYAWTLKEDPAGAYAVHAHYALGFIAQQEGDIPAALRAFDAFLKMAPDHQLASRVRFTRADLWRRNGQLQKAAAAFQTLSQTFPSGGMQEESLFRWAELAYELKNYPEAQTAYQQLIQAYPKSPRLAASLYGLGWSALRQEQCQTAVTPWEQLIPEPPPDGITPEQIREVHYHLGICYIELEDHARARQHLRQVTRDGEDTMEQREAVIKVAALAYRAGDFDEAIAFYTRALTTAEAQRAPHFHFLLGESYQVKGDTETAITHWQEVLKGAPALPFYPTALDRLGRAYVAKRDWKQAASMLRRLWDEFLDFPERPAVALGLAQAYSQLNECEAALPFYAALGESAPGRTALHELRHHHAACLFATAHYNDVVALLAPILAPGESIDPTLLYTLGQAHMELQQFEAAIAPFTRLQDEFPAHPLHDAMLPRLAYAFEQTKRPGKALDAWQAHVRSATNIDATERLRLHLHMGRLALQAKRFEEALALLPQTREAAATDMAAETLFWRAEAHYELQQWEEAKQRYQTLLEQHGTEGWGVAAQFRLGIVYEKQQEWDLALDTYRKLRDSATDAEMIANAKRRIAAIEAGLVRSLPQPSPPVKRPKTPPSSEG